MMVEDFAVRVFIMYVPVFKRYLLTLCPLFLVFHADVPNCELLLRHNSVNELLNHHIWEAFQTVGGSVTAHRNDLLLFHS